MWVMKTFCWFGNYSNVEEYNLVNNTYVSLGTTRNISVVNNQVGYADDASTPTEFTCVYYGNS